MLEKKLVPKLRFAEFDGVWEIKRLGEIAKFSKGKNLSKIDITEEGLNECVRYGELYTTYNETIDEIHSRTNLRLEDSVLSKANDIIIPASGETQLDIATASCVLKDNVILGGDLNIIRTKNSGVFLSYYLNSKKKIDIARLSQGSSVIHLYSSQLSLLKLNIPQLPEQQKIASFLTEVDTKLSQLTKKKALLENYKKGVMQQIFSQELRFKDGNGNDYSDWEEKQLRDLATYRRGSFPQPYGLPKWYDKKNGTPFVQVYDVDDNMLLKLTTKNKISALGAKQSVFVEKGTLVITIQGSIGKIAKTQYDAYVDRTLLIFQSYKRPLNIDYFKYVLFLLFEIEKMKAPGGIIKTITKEVLSSFHVMIPSLEEQTKIANFLSELDTKIEVLSTSIENTQTFKKGLLQQLFV
jgi:type I restriction enzyme S subunit